jgi:site-specific DNA-methyltransferase (adenine-specific)
MDYIPKELTMILEGDCLEIMPTLADKSVDMILCDLPYGATACKWDTVIPFEHLWKQYKRLIKYNGAIVLTASQPFTSALVMSNPRWFKYTWVWDKVNKFSGHLNAKHQPMRQTEDIIVFCETMTKYNPQMFTGKPYSATSSGNKSQNYGWQVDKVKTICDGNRYPRNLLAIKGDERGTVGRIHPTQKPVALFEYLIRTYTNEGDTVLDNCAGSGTTGVACINTNRKFILIEKDPEYCEIIRKRIDAAKLPLFPS